MGWYNSVTNLVAKAVEEFVPSCSLFLQDTYEVVTGNIRENPDNASPWCWQREGTSSFCQPSFQTYFLQVLSDTAHLSSLLNKSFNLHEEGL